MKPKLCLYTDSLEPSGVGEHMLALAAELSRQFRVSFVCPASQSGLAFLKRAKALSLKTLALEVLGESINQNRSAIGCTLTARIFSTVTPESPGKDTTVYIKHRLRAFHHRSHRTPALSHYRFTAADELSKYAAVG